MVFIIERREGKQDTGCDSVGPGIPVSYACTDEAAGGYVTSKLRTSSLLQCQLLAKKSDADADADTMTPIRHLVFVQNVFVSILVLNRRNRKVQTWHNHNDFMI
ncbi:unnamed protein product [Amoebophrya sp. A25]|nr:unnamed protein product [Amoebophrya sp. A25]|eukprot:GSA25T00014237001.1